MRSKEHIKLRKQSSNKNATNLGSAKSNGRSVGQLEVVAGVQARVLEQVVCADVGNDTR